MPEGVAGLRARQLSTLAGISHEMAVSEDLAKLVEELSGAESLDDRQQANAKQTLKDIIKAKKYSTKFVEELSRSVSEAFAAWQEAKTKADFKIFAPKLKKLVDLKRQECELLGYKEHPYDALLDNHEPGLTTKEVEILFDEVRKELVPFVQKIAAQPAHSTILLHRHFPKDKQWDFS